MSVIVTGINMPQNCTKCPCLHYGKYESSDHTYCGVRMLGLFTSKTGRPNGCQLKSVNELIEQIEKYGCNEEKSAYKNLHPSYTRGLKDTIKIIKEYCEMEEQHG